MWCLYVSMFVCVCRYVCIVLHSPTNHPSRASRFPYKELFFVHFPSTDLVVSCSLFQYHVYIMQCCVYIHPNITKQAQKIFVLFVSSSFMMHSKLFLILFSHSVSPEFILAVILKIIFFFCCFCPLCMSFIFINNIYQHKVISQNNLKFH